MRFIYIYIYIHKAYLHLDYYILLRRYWIIQIFPIFQKYIEFLAFDFLFLTYRITFSDFRKGPRMPNAQEAIQLGPSGRSGVHNPGAIPAEVDSSSLQAK